MTRRICPCCERLVNLADDGRVVNHPMPEYPGIKCEGSGSLPEEPYEMTEEPIQGLPDDFRDNDHDGLG